MSSLQKKVHDLRKPLNVISMQAELIKMLIEDKPDSEKIIQAASKIIENAKSCSSMLQELVDDE